MAKQLIIHALAIFGACLFILPFLFVLSTSLKETHQIFTFPIEWLPDPIRWDNYIEAWTTRLPFNLFFRNTVIITAFVVVGQVFSCSCAAYAFSRLRWRGRDVLFIVLLSTLMLPPQVVIIPQFILFKHMRWINTFYPLIIPWVFGRGAFPIFLLRQYFMTIPLELDDAAKIDGCGFFDIYWRILLPSAKPALGAVAIQGFMYQWNNFLEPLIFLNDKSKFPLALGLRMFQTDTEVYWNWLMAATIIASLPCVIVFFLCQRYFIQGIVVSGVKG